MIEQVNSLTSIKFNKDLLDVYQVLEIAESPYKTSFNPKNKEQLKRVHEQSLKE